MNDLWGGDASSVTNRGMILAKAVSKNELATARGVYLWGGAGGRVINEGAIDASASSQSSTATPAPDRQPTWASSKRIQGTEALKLTWP